MRVLTLCSEVGDSIEDPLGDRPTAARAMGRMPTLTVLETQRVSSTTRRANNEFAWHGSTILAKTTRTSGHARHSSA